MNRLTKRDENGIAYLVNVKQDEQAIEGTRNTLQCVFDSWQRLADLEDAIEIGRLVEILCRCKECNHYESKWCYRLSNYGKEYEVFENDFCSDGEKRRG